MAIRALNGQWKNFVFRMASDIVEQPKILQHLRNNYYLDEPLCKLVGSSKDRVEDLDRRVLEYLNQGLSFVALDTDTENVAGVWINFHKYRHTIDVPSNIEATKDFKSSHTYAIVSFLKKLDQMTNVFDYYNVDHYIEQFICSTDRSYRRMGIGQEMHARSIALCREQGHKVVKGFYTNHIVREMARRHGYEELCRKYIRDFEHRQGVKLFGTNSEPDQFVSIMAMKIN